MEHTAADLRGGQIPCTICSGRSRPYSTATCNHCSALILEWKTQMAARLARYKGLQQANKALQSNIQNELTARKKYDALQVRKQLLLHRARVLQEKTLALQRATYEEKTTEQRRTEENNRREEKVLINNNELAIAWRQAEEHYGPAADSNLQPRKRIYKEFAEQLADKRKEYAHSLLSVVGVAVVDDQTARIVNIVLPNSGDYTIVQPRQLVSVGLGYIAQAVNLLAKYLDVSLPFRIDPRGSESLIYREDSSYVGASYCSGDEVTPHENCTCS
eukprot:TRINITY_DN5472_c0_g1_i1.p1 TRINITY_DN5472_c0_g1~~TRINITY_DN5472_c0_g1_i1.p1  ORF type:complete len:304 (-),score=31.15 TRINITY_DN5472_c0_g1_i1:330-1151(-)